MYKNIPKKIYSGLLFSFFMLGLSACKEKNPEELPPTTLPTESTEESSPSTEPTSETLEIIEGNRTDDGDSMDIELKYANNDAYIAGKNFLKSLETSNIDEAVAAIEPYENSIIRPEHMKQILLESEWKNIIGKKDPDYLFLSFDQRYPDNKRIIFKLDNKQYELPLVLIDNEWKVSMDKYIIKDFQFVAPWEVKVFWDGIPLDREKYAEQINTGNTIIDIYTITCAPVKINFKFVSDEFGNFIREITPKYISKPYELDRSFDEQQRAECLQGIQTMWNTMFKDYQNNMEVDEWCYKHFAYITETEGDLEYAIYDQVGRFLKNNNLESVEMIDIKPWNDNFCGISMNRVATANFSYKLKMIIKQPPVEIDGVLTDQPSKEVISEEFLSNIRVEKAKHGYIIFELTDPNLFNNNIKPSTIIN